MNYARAIATFKNGYGDLIPSGFTYSFRAYHPAAKNPRNLAYVSVDAEKRDNFPETIKETITKRFKVEMDFFSNAFIIDSEREYFDIILTKDNIRTLKSIYRFCKLYQGRVKFIPSVVVFPNQVGEWYEHKIEY